MLAFASRLLQRTRIFGAAMTRTVAMKTKFTAFAAAPGFVFVSWLDKVSERQRSFPSEWAGHSEDWNLTRERALGDGWQITKCDQLKSQEDNTVFAPYHTSPNDFVYRIEAVSATKPGEKSASSTRTGYAFVRTCKHWRYKRYAVIQWDDEPKDRSWKFCDNKRPCAVCSCPFCKTDT